MKNKITLTIILLCIMLFITSCDSKMQYLTPEDESDKEIEDDNIFTYTESDDNVDKVVQGNLSEGFCKIVIHNNELYFPCNSVYRYNTNTGNVTSVCTDPVCTHNTKECPFFAVTSMGSFYVSDNTVYFTVDNPIRDENHSKSGFGYYEYDTQNGHAAESKAYRSDTSQFFGGILYSGNSQYYYDYYHDENSGEWKFYLCRYTRNDNKTTVICEFEDYNTVLIDKIDNLLWYNDGTSIGSINEDTGEKTEIYRGIARDASHDDEYFYYRNYIQDNVDLNGLYRLKIGSDQPEYLGENNVAYYYLTNNYIYFKYEENSVIGKDSRGNDIDIWGQKIWRMKKDGTDKELVFEFKDELSKTNIYYFCVLGNYIYGFYSYYDDSMEYHGSNNLTDINNPSIMRIDVTNGEIYYINVSS